MEFEWDEQKRHQTIEKHGLDFVDAVEVVAQPHLVIAARSEIEARQLAVGIINGIEIAVVFTYRSDVIRLITARRARPNERKQYQALLSGRNPEDEESD